MACSTLENVYIEDYLRKEVYKCLNQIHMNMCFLKEHSNTSHRHLCTWIYANVPISIKEALVCIKSNFNTWVVITRFIHCTPRWQTQHNSVLVWRSSNFPFRIQGFFKSISSISEIQRRNKYERRKQRASENSEAALFVWFISKFVLRLTLWVLIRLSS